MSWERPVIGTVRQPVPMLINTHKKPIKRIHFIKILLMDYYLAFLRQKTKPFVGGTSF